MVVIKNIKNMGTVSTKKFADILHFNDDKQIFHAFLFDIRSYSPEGE